MSRPGVIYMALTGLAFASMAVFVKLASERLPALEIVLARALFSLVVSYALLRRASIPPLGRRRGLLLLRGAFGCAGLCCVFTALRTLPLAEATVIQYLHPAFTALLAPLFLGERTSGRLWMAVAVSFAGVLFVTRPPFVFGGAWAFEPLALLAALGGAFFSACAYITVRRLAGDEHPLVIILYFPLVTVPAVLPFVAPDLVWPDLRELLLLLGVGVGAQAGQIFITRGFAHETASRGTALAFLQVVFAAGFGVIVFGDTLGPSLLFGASLIAGGTLLAIRDGAATR